MTPQELTDKLYTLIEGLMTTQAAFSNPLPVIPIVKSFQNNGRPKPPYIAYDPNPSLRKIGRAHKGKLVDDKIEYLTEIEARVKVRQIGLNGEYLHLFSDMLEFPLIQRIFDEEGIVAMPAGPVIPVPKLIQNNEYEKESVMDLVLHFTTSMFDETVTQLLTVEVTSNVTP